MSDMIFGAPKWLRDPLPGLATETVRRQRLDDALRECSEIAQRGHYRRTVKDINIAEGYLTGDLYVRIIASSLDGPVLPEVGYHNAFFKVSRAGHNDSDFGVSHDKVLHDAGRAQSADGDQIAVFVNVAKTAERPEALVPSLIRLEFKDLLLNLGRDSNE